MRITTTCPIDPRYDLAGFMAWHRDAYGALRMEGDGGAAGDGTGGSDGSGKAGDGSTGVSGDGTAGQSDRGFPEGTPLTEMSVEQREAYWKHQARKHENVAKSRADYDELKSKAAEADRLRQEHETEAEKRIREAAENAAKQEREKSTPRLVTAEFRAAAAGRIERDRLTTLLEDLDLSKYLTATGEVDEDKVAKKVAAWAPTTDSGKKKVPDLGQGRRQGGTDKGAGGAAEAQRRFGGKTSTTSTSS